MEHPVKRVGVLPPLQVEIGGAVFEVLRLNRKRLRQLAEIERQAEEQPEGLGRASGSLSKLDLVYDQLSLLLGAEAREAIEEIDVNEAVELYAWIMDQAKGKFAPGDAEGNAPAPGGESSPK